MKTLLTFLLAFSFAGAVSQSFKDIDKSPMDCAYFPDNFAHDRKDGEKAIMRVLYSRPAKAKREVFGKLVPYGKVWRTGANEATEIKLYQDITFGDKKLTAGTYALFTIPGEKEWAIIFNSQLDYWGAYSYDEKADVLRTQAKVVSGKKEIENFTIQFDGNGNNAGVMRLAWDKTIVEVPFSY
jgi:hypothetical protein